MSASTLSEIQQRIALLEAEAEKLRAAAAEERRKLIAGVVLEVRSKMTKYGIGASDLGIISAPVARPQRINTPKAEGIQIYRSPSGEIWKAGSRGRKPKWLTGALAQGRKLSDFLST